MGDIAKQADPHGLLEQSLEWIERLVSIDTTSTASNLPLITLVADHLESLGVLVAIRPNAGGDKANLIGTIPGVQSATTGGLVLSGHTDVVPVAGQEWASDPFTTDIRDGRLHGRGTTDMKSFLGVAIALAPQIIEARLPHPVHFVLSYDEEIGLHGGAQLPGDLADLGLTPRYCIVGEPTNMEVIAAHKSIGIIDIVVRGTSAHSSLAPTAVNAVVYAARMIAFAQEIADRFRAEGPFDAAYDVPFSTVSVNQIEGGGLGNTVPERCVLRLDFRTVGQVDPQQVLAQLETHAAKLSQEMEAIAPQAGIEVRPLSISPGLDTPTESELVEMLTLASAPSKAAKKAYATEAGFFSSAGIQTVVCGPGDIAQAHTANEFVTIDQVRLCGEILSATVTEAGKEQT